MAIDQLTRDFHDATVKDFRDDLQKSVSFLNYCLVKGKSRPIFLRAFSIHAEASRYKGATENELKVAENYYDFYTGEGKKLPSGVTEVFEQMGLRISPKARLGTAEFAPLKLKT